MKIEEAKNIVAVKHGFEHFPELLKTYHSTLKLRALDNAINEAALLHTKHHVEQALKAASEEAVNKIIPGAVYDRPPRVIDKESILNAYSIENIQ